MEREEFRRGHVRTTEEIELLEAEEELWTDDGSGDYAGWFCVRTEPFPCPAAGCVFVAEFMTAAHLILVWEERDDPNLLRHAQRAKEVGRNPRVVIYVATFGPERLLLRVGGGGPAGSRRSGQVIEHRFGGSAPYSVGVEEELMILDGGTLLLTPRWRS